MPKINGSVHLVQFQFTHQNQWEFQDPKMEVLYHIRPYFLGIFPYIGLTGLLCGRYLQFRILKIPLKKWDIVNITIENHHV